MFSMQTGVGHSLTHLKSGDLSQQDTVRNGMGRQKGGRQVVRVAGFSTMRPELERVWERLIRCTLQVRHGRLTEATGSSPCVQRRHVCIHVVEPASAERKVNTCTMANTEHGLTSKSKAVPEPCSTPSPQGTCGTTSFPPWIRRRRCQSRRFAGGRCATPGDWKGPE
jgi:hypothetical protein